MASICDRQNAANDPFAGRGAIHTCVLCGWSYGVRGRSLVALDEAGIPMGGEEARVRLASFEEGPCTVAAEKLTPVARPIRAAETRAEGRIVSG